MLKYHIQTIEVQAGGVAAITFSNIPQIYDDLYLVISARGTFAANNGAILMSVNGDNAYTNGNTRWLQGNGSASSSSSATFAVSGIMTGANSTANTFGSGQVLISNYKSTSPKSISQDWVTEENATQAFQRLTAGIANISQAVTTISLITDHPLFAQFSSASLYGIRRGSDGRTEVVASGGVVTTGGGFTTHTFTGSGTFTANRGMTAEVLVVAGGGGGGRGETQTGFNAGGGGGGAGGYLAQSTFINAGSYSVIVGGGGAGGPASTNGSPGSPSNALSLSAIGGGGGGENNTSGGAGGSGGGGGGLNNGLGGAGTPGQGNNGGNGGTSNSPHSAGGGGAGAAGANVTAGPTPGGAGLQWVDGNFYAGGGGGGGYTVNAAGGIGGGGASGLNTGNAVAGTANTGGGGGASGLNASAFSGNSAAGGSGVVIIRYLTPAS